MNNNVEPFVPRDRLLLVSIAKTIGKTKSIYDAARFAWPVNVDRARNVDLVLACVGGIVKGVFVARLWMEATKKSFPDLVPTHRDLRWGFEGVEADQAIQANYLEKRVPDNITIGQNGFRYFDDPVA
jgi:hypothetical protein